MKIPRSFCCIVAVLLLSSGCDSAEVEATRAGNLKSEIEEKKKARAELEKEINEATALEAWTLASMPIQPLVVNIIRSMQPGSEIERLQLERDAATPSQLRVSLVLHNASDKQLDQTLSVIHGMNFRESNQTCTRSNGELVYTARLLWQPHQPQNSQSPKHSQQPATEVSLISGNKAKISEADVGETRSEEEELQFQLGIEQRLLDDLQRQSADLLNFVSAWEPYFAVVEEQQAVQASIRMKVREAAMQTLSQSYEQVPHKMDGKDIESLPFLTRATLLFDDDYRKLLDWLGSMEKTKPTMRTGKLDLSKGSRGNNLRMELTLEVPLRRRGP